MVQGVVACISDKVIQEGEMDVDIWPLVWNGFSECRLAGSNSNLCFLLPEVKNLTV
jgi:hypothetical protein